MNSVDEKFPIETIILSAYIGTIECAMMMTHSFLVPGRKLTNKREGLGWVFTVDD